MILNTIVADALDKMLKKNPVATYVMNLSGELVYESKPLSEIGLTVTDLKPLTDAVLNGVRLVLRDAITLAAGGTQTVSVDPAVAQRLARTLTDRQLLACMDVIAQLTAARARNMNQALLITLLCARLRAAAGR